jgi:hypothetical protein
MLVIYGKSRLNRSSEGEGRELPATPVWRHFPALFSAPSVEPRDLSRNAEKKEILSKTFILDSHRPFICSASKALAYVRGVQAVFTGFIFCLSMFRKEIFNCICCVLFVFDLVK